MKMLADTHCHLDFPSFDTDRIEVINQLHSNQIKKVINVGVSLAASQKVIELARQFPFLYATVGVHPEEMASFSRVEELTSEIKKMAGQPKVVAIGECGLDYFRLTENVEENKAKQKELFRVQIKLSQELQLPLVIHSREAFADCMEMLKAEQVDWKKVVFHSWSYSPKELQQVLELGVFFGINAIVTYPKAANVVQSVELIPLSKILLETDAPFLPPQGYRGERNEPKYVQQVAEKIAEIKKIPVDEVADQTLETAESFYALKD